MASQVVLPTSPPDEGGGPASAALLIPRLSQRTPHHCGKGALGDVTSCFEGFQSRHFAFLSELRFVLMGALIGFVLFILATKDKQMLFSLMWCELTSGHHQACGQCSVEP